jgi:hypothetical protein
MLRITFGAKILGQLEMRLVGDHVEASRRTQTTAILRALHNTMGAVPHSF